MKNSSNKQIWQLYVGMVYIAKILSMLDTGNKYKQLWNGLSSEQRDVIQFSCLGCYLSIDIGPLD